MTFELSAPLVTLICCLLVCFILGGIFGYRRRDWGEVFAGLIVGIIIGGIGYLITAGVQGSRAAGIIAEAHLAAMPEDWRGLHRLLQETELRSTKEEYIADFLKNKTEPEISMLARDALIDIHGWRILPKELLAPHTIIDVHAAIAALPKPTKE